MAERQRPMRADAVRNRGRILDAARTEITAEGPQVGMDEIARRAGVAVGTLYRHFPTKVDLVAAVLAEYTEQMTVAAEAARDAATAGTSPLVALIDFLLEVIRVSALNQAVKNAAPGLGADDVADQTRAATALDELISAGVRAGQVREDLTVIDVYTLILAAPLEQPAPIRDRWAELMLPCLTAEAAAINLPLARHAGPRGRTPAPAPSVLPG